jgi:hypothetical protein
MFANTGASGAALGTATVTASTDTLSITAHGLADGTVVVTSSPTGGASGVLVTGAPYYVANAAANTFQLRPSPGAPVMLFSSDGTVVVDQAASVNTAQGMREALGGLIAKGRSASAPDVGRFGARAGVLRNGTTPEVTRSGTTINVEDMNIVLTPVPSGSQPGPYLCAIESDSHTLTAADGSNDRIDLLVGRMRDAAVDSSGVIEADTYLLDGTPAAIPVPETLPEGEFEIASILVPQSGTGDPELTYDPEIAVAAGGAIPVSTSSRLPTVAVRPGDLATVANTKTVALYDGTDWNTVASANGYQYWQTITYTASGTFTKASYTGLRAVRMRVQAGGGAGGGAQATSATQGSAGGGGQAGNYSEKWVLSSALSASETVTVGAAGAANTGAAGSAGGQSSVGTHCTASGGAGGPTGTASTGFNGQNASPHVTTGTGDVVVVGEAGGIPMWSGGTGVTVFASGGAGGSSRFGAGGRQRFATSGYDGQEGQGKGAGGAGAGNGNSQAARPGGIGGAGIVYIDLYV